jgi:8-amino-7-oxononanoate synthase
MPHDPLGWIAGELAALERQGLRRRLVERAGPQGPIVHDAGRPLVNFASNDYLALAADPRLVAAAQQAGRAEGWGAGASPLISGHTASHARLEERLAEWLGTEAALVFPSGFAANVGAVSALVGRGDAVFGDAKNHASLIDGCRLSRAEVFVYPHGDCAALAEQLQSAAGFRRRLIVSDSLFSMDGDLAPLAELAELAGQHDAMLLVDEAHATGVFGPHGSGLVELLSLADRVHVRVGTLSKALGSAGGFVAGSRSLIDWLTNRARSYVFSTAHPPAVCAAAMAAIDIVRDEPWRRTELLLRAAELRNRLTADGWNEKGDILLFKNQNVPFSSQNVPFSSQIIPLIVGDADRTMRLAAALREHGFWVPGIRPPSVPPGESLLRISVSYGHTSEQLQDLAEVLGRLQSMTC